MDTAPEPSDSNRSLYLLIGLLVAAVVGVILLIQFVITPAVSSVNNANSRAVESQLAAPGKAATALEVQADVKATVVNASTTFGVDPNADPATVQVVSSGSDSIRVSGNGVTGYTVVGSDPKSGYTYTYSSLSGQYTSNQ
jgi:hypothetical protein